MTSFQQAIDALPIVGIFVVFAVLSWLVIQGGYWVGRRWQKRTSEEEKGPTQMIVGSLLALMAFLLAITVGMAADRFDARRSLVLAEANAIGTAYLRAGYLEEPASREIRALLYEYVTLRIATSDVEDVQRGIDRSADIQAELWSKAEAMARATPESEVLGLFIVALNEVFDLHEARVTVGMYARLPGSVLLLLLVGSWLTLAIVGFAGGLSPRRSSITTVVLIVVLSAVITLVFDLDRPQGGTLKVSQKPIVDLLQQIETRQGSS